MANAIERQVWDQRWEAAQSEMQRIVAAWKGESLVIADTLHGPDLVGCDGGNCVSTGTKS